MPLQQRPAAAGDGGRGFLLLLSTEILFSFYADESVLHLVFSAIRICIVSSPQRTAFSGRPLTSLSGKLQTQQ